jgi:ABC-type branched-subunit amino acid transport system ATPase component/ABC-type branched-subunit amino acid transport system permease subunit
VKVALARGAAAVAGLLVLTRLFPHTVPFGVVVQGALFGVLTGLLAIGLVLLYRVSRAVNFAYGAMGGVGAALGAGLYLGHHWPWPVALLVATAAGGLLGAGVGAVVVWRFQRSSRLVLTVATIGMAQLLGGIELLEPRYVGAPNLITSFETGLNRVHVTIHPVIFSGNDLVLVAVVPLIVAALSWFLLRTRTGIAVRAIADNDERARLLGVPSKRLMIVVWLVAGAVASLAVLLQAPTSGIPLDVAAGPTILLPPLAAAVVARMERMWVAFLAGVGLGVLEAVVRWNVSKQSVQTAAFLVIVLVALALQHRGEGRGEAADESSWAVARSATRLPPLTRDLPEVRLGRAALYGGLGLVAVTLPAWLPDYRLNQVSVALVFGLLAVSLVVLTGWGGTVSLGQFALLGVGGVVAGDVIAKWNGDLFLALAAGALAGAVVAVLIGLPALRVRGLFLAVTTLAFAVAVDAFFFNPANYGDQMPASVVRPVLWKRFALAHEGDLYLVCLGALLLAIVLLRGVRRARPGRAIVAARDNLRAAEAAAVPTTRVRLGAFALSGAIAGVAGGLYVLVVGGVGFHTFQPADSILVFSMTVIGGFSVSGALLGVALVEWLGIVFPKAQLILAGTGLLFVLAVFPEGLAGIVERLRDRLVAVAARRRGIALDAWSSDDTAEIDLTAPAPGRLDGPALLRCEGVDARYGALQVLFGVDVDVREGEILALVGTNGAGKSSLLRAVTGLLPPAGGRVTFDGREVTGMAPERLAGLGVTLVPGGRGVFASLTVEENLNVAAWPLRRDPDAIAAAHRRVTELFPILEQRSAARACDLSGGEQQMLSLAMAFYVLPRLLCIDELSLGLAPAVVSRLADAVRDIHRQGTTVVVVEQSVDVALLLAERAVFMEKGQVRFTGPTAGLLDRPDLLRAVFIGDVETSTNGNGSRPAAPAGGAPVLECVGLRKRFGGIVAVDEVDLTVGAGEVVGLIGHNGAGKTTLFDLISGFLTPDQGRVVVGDWDVTTLPPHARAVEGLGRSFQEARLFPTLTVAETIAVALERHLANRDGFAAAFRMPASTDAEAVAAERVEEIVEILGLAGYRERPTGELSTGTRRIVELACVLAHDPAVLLLDEPSAGVAQRETEALGPLLRKVAGDTGCAIVVIEHDMALLASLCHRMVALELGAVIAGGPPREVLAHPRVIASYLGAEAATAPRPRPARRRPLRSAT